MTVSTLMCTSKMTVDSYFVCNFLRCSLLTYTDIRSDRDVTHVPESEDNNSSDTEFEDIYR